jgi:AcrR family transcriptional regulator
MTQGQPRTKEKDQRTAEIAAAAKEIFLKKGYFGSTVEEIARGAGVSKGTVYLYFKNKDELYASLMLPSIEESVEMLLGFEKDVADRKYKKGSDIVMRFHDWLVKLYQYDPESLRILQVYQLLDLSRVMDEKAREKHWTLAKKSIEISVRTVSDAMKQGLLPEMNPSQLNYIMWASFLGIIQVEESKLRTTGKDHILETLKACFTILAEGLEKRLENEKNKREKKSNPKVGKTYRTSAV